MDPTRNIDGAALAADAIRKLHAKQGKNGQAARPSAAPLEAPASRLTHIRELLAEPEEALSWIVDGLLPAGGLSILGGKPKCGKTTLARAAALRVSRGEPVLGRATERGPVIYLGLEDPRRITRGHFRTLGATDQDDLWVFSGGRPDQAVQWLQQKLEEVDPVLVVVDTLQALLGVSDLNDYAVVTSALNPILALVRPRRAHLQFIHHAGKGERVGFDSLLGSTALQGVPDVILLLRRREDHTRTLASLQRMGADLPESVVTLDEHQEPQLGPPKADFEAQQLGERILAFLGTLGTGERVPQKHIFDAVEGQAQVKHRALQALVKAGRVERTGEGKKGAPFLFCCSRYTPGIAEQNPEKGTSSRNDATYAIPEKQGVLTAAPNPGNSILPPLGAGDAWES